MLKDNIQRQCLTITTDILCRYVHNFVSRLQLLQRNDSQHSERLFSAEHSLSFIIIYYINYWISYHMKHHVSAIFWSCNKTPCHCKHVCQFLLLYIYYSINDLFFKCILTFWSPCTFISDFKWIRWFLQLLSIRQIELKNFLSSNGDASLMFWHTNKIC